MRTRGCTLPEAIGLIAFCAGLAMLMAGLSLTMSERREGARVAELHER